MEVVYLIMTKNVMHFKNFSDLLNIYIEWFYWTQLVIIASLNALFSAWLISTCHGADQGTILHEVEHGLFQFHYHTSCNNSLQYHPCTTNNKYYQLQATCVNTR